MDFLIDLFTQVATLISQMESNCTAYLKQRHTAPGIITVGIDVATTRKGELIATATASILPAGGQQTKAIHSFLLERTTLMAWRAMQHADVMERLVMKTGHQPAGVVECLAVMVAHELHLEVNQKLALANFKLNGN